MATHRVAALTGRILAQLRRDHRTLGLIFVVPLVILSLLAYLVGLQGSRPTLGVVNEGGAVYEAVVARLEASGALQVTRLAPAEAEQALRNGLVEGVLHFRPPAPPRSGEESQSPWQLTLEGSDPQKSGALLSQTNRVLLSALMPPGAGVERALVVEPQFLYGGPQFDTLDYFAPVLIPLFSFIFVFLLTSVSFLRERTQGTYERLMASPLSRLEMVLGYMLGFGLLALLQSTVLLLYAIFVLRIHFAGSLAIIFLVVAVMTVVAVNLGVLLSGFARNEFQAVQFMPMVIFPQALLSGAFWPVKDFPLPLRLVSQVLPLTYSTEALRAVMIKGLGLTSATVLTPLAILVGFGLLFLALSAIALRREVA